MLWPMDAKPPSESFTEMTELVLPQHANAIGTAFGLEATERLTRRSVELEVILRGRDTALVDLLHQCGWPATWHHAAGAHGDVTVVVSTVAARDIHDLLGIVTRAFPDAFWTEREISGVRSVRPSLSPTCR